MERTLVLIQNDAIRRGLQNEIIKRFSDAGLKIISKKEVVPTREMAEGHYRATEEQIVGMGNNTLRAWRDKGYSEENVAEFFGSAEPRKIGEQLLEWARQFITGKKLIALIIEGDNAIQKVRQIVGYTDPIKAKKGTIRGDFAADSIAKANLEKRKVENLVHAADSTDSAEKEIAIWFPELKK
ncbi:MAG TPA: nucleoside-diphosphate kinase [archaeon]|nr:nucleoside-diphosphate kinase [archaeon]